jgi:CBS domain-containing protein
MAAGLPADGTDTGAPEVADATRAVASFRLDDPAETIAQRLRESGEDWAAIVDAGGVLLGRVRLEDTDGPGTTAGCVMQSGPSTYRPNVPLDELLVRMRDKGFAKAFVTDPEGKLLGLITREDIEALLNNRSGIAASTGRS